MVLKMANFPYFMKGNILPKITNLVTKTTFFLHGGILKRSRLGFPVGPFRPGKSREGPGTGRDRTGPKDLEGPVFLWSRD